MDFILDALIALVPSIVGPILCMVILKTKFLLFLNKPIDNNTVLKDGKRMFGDNKTIRGFFTYVFSTVIVSIIWGVICSQIDILGNNNALYMVHKNTMLFNGMIGFLYGVAYAIFELPNSFIKRRFNVDNSNVREIKSIKKYIFRLVDLIDSAIGCVLVLALFYKMTGFQYIVLVLIGGLLHYIIVFILYKLKIKKEI